VRNFIQDLDHIIALKLHSSEGSFHDHGCITLLELLVLNTNNTDHNTVLNKLDNYVGINGTALA